MDQSNRYADLSLKEEDLIKGDKHVLVAYHMQPATGYGYLATAAHIAAESSTGTNVEVCTTDDFTRGVDALVYQIDEPRELMKIAYPVDLFDRNIIDGRAMIASFLTLTIARWCNRHPSWTGIQAFRQGMAPIVVGVLLSGAWLLARADGHWAASGGLWIVSGVCTLLVWRTRLHLLWMLSAGALVGAAGLI